MTVHTYVTGASFDNIYGEKSPSYFGYITHITELTPLMKQRWPWLKGTWNLGDHKTCYGYFKTLKEARQRAKEIWPQCDFQTLKQIRKQSERAN